MSQATATIRSWGFTGEGAVGKFTFTDIWDLLSIHSGLETENELILIGVFCIFRMSMHIYKEIIKAALVALNKTTWIYVCV